MRGISINLPLKGLREALEYATTAECFSDKAKELQRKKITDLKQAIKGLESFAESLESRVGSVRTAADAAVVRESITEQKLFFVGSPEAPTIEAALIRCGFVEKCLGTLAELPVANFRTPAERDDCVNRLAQIRDLTGGQLSPQQTQLLSDAEDKIQSRTKCLIQEACDWVTKMRARLQNCEAPDLLLDDLRQTPDFLPEEKQEDVAAVTREVQSLMDQDSCANIRRLFQRIVDVDAREKLLQELQSMISEGQAV